MKKPFMQKATAIIISAVLIIGMAVCAAILVGKTSVPAMATIENGLSAYEMAVQHGYRGTVQDWLDSLNSKSAYDIAKESGYTGTEAEWNTALEATAAEDGVGIKTASFSDKDELLLTLTDDTVVNLGAADGNSGITTANVNSDGQLVLTLSDCTAVNMDKLVGVNSNDGRTIVASEVTDSEDLMVTYANGTTKDYSFVPGDLDNDGRCNIKDLAALKLYLAGVGNITAPAGGTDLSEVMINENGELVLIMTDGSVKIAGKVKGSDGADGIGINNISITDGNLVITLSNGSNVDLGNIKGDKGDQGVGISAVTIDEAGHLQLTLTTDTTIDLGNVKGADGQNGVGIDEIYIQDGDLYVKKTTDTAAINLGSVKGEKGDKGDKGDTGRGIAKTEIIDGHLWITYTDDLENPVDLGKVTDPEYDGTEGLEFYLLPDGTYGVKAGTTIYLENIVIPSIYKGQPVTTILENGFEAMRNLKTIIIPDSITTIEKYAFNNCTVLETADMPDTVTSIGAYAFNNCSSLTKITIPSQITVIEEYTFYGCTGATKNTIIIPKSVTKIMPHALQISNDMEIFFEEAGTWNFNTDKTYSDRYGESTYREGGKNINLKVDTNYSSYFYGTRLRLYVDSDSYYDKYFKTNECTWTKQ